MDGSSDSYGKQPVRIKIISMGNTAVGKVLYFDGCIISQSLPVIAIHFD